MNLLAAATSTFALLEKARNGDDRALSKVFEQYRRRLIVLVHFKLSPQWRERGEVEDVVQEVCLRAFRDLDRFTYRTPGSLMHWFSAIADHVIADRARYRNRECRAGEEVPFRSETNPLGPEPADNATPSRLFSQQEAVERLLARLGRLPDDYRQAILLARIEGLPTAEVAERMGKSREQVALLVYRAVKRLRELA
ncbi:MAG: RNA polymerase sigma factor [Acidobacteriota bacterium]